MRNNGKRATAVAAIFAATAAVSASTLASADESANGSPKELESATTYADVDGDGQDNAVTVREISQDRQTLTFSFAGESINTTFDADARPPLQQPRPVDIDGDGQDEVVVAQAVGANTITFNIWKFDPRQGIVQLTTSAGAPFDVYEGGGVASNSGYGCDATESGREFVTVEAQATGTSGDEPLYDGDRTTYSVDGNATTVESRTPINQAPIGDPLLETNPDTCTP